jgi:tol-pal system beta propeller repeat protein TolB
MKNFSLSIVTLVMSVSLYAESINFSVSNAQKNEKVKILLYVVDQPSDELNNFVQLTKKALEFKDQCNVTTCFNQHMPKKQDALAYKEYSYILFVHNHPRHYDWRLFEIDSGTMIKNKKVTKHGNLPRAWAYSFADSVYETLTKDPAFFSTKIAYAKEIPQKNGTHYTHLYIADYDGSNPELLVSTPTINVSPRWNNDANRPLLFYSENTNANMRMMASDMKQKRVVASNFDGLNMLPSFSPDGMSVVYCATRGSGKCQLYRWSGKQLKNLTNNNGNNFAPAYGAQGKEIFFSSDFETGQPQIYSYQVDTQELTRITSDGYCTSPTYCTHTNKLGYAKLVNGVMQLFAYDVKSKKHTQLTFDNVQKDECVWSPCGTFLMCPYDNGKTSKVTLFNTITGKYTHVTHGKESCYYPAWSTTYNEYPTVRT